MTELKILQYPHPFLRKIADPIQHHQINSKLDKIINNMFRIMYKQNGIGLAATQLGLNMRLFIMDNYENNHQKIIAINPQILEKEGETIEEEGCLSFPGISTKIHRAKWIKMQALNNRGEEYIIESKNYLGRCIQHEIDHLNGIIYLDYLSPLKQSRIKKKYNKLTKKLK